MRAGKDEYLLDIEKKGVRVLVYIELIIISYLVLLVYNSGLLLIIHCFCICFTLIWTCIHIEFAIYLNFRHSGPNGLRLFYGGIVRDIVWFCLIVARENIKILNVPIEQQVVSSIHLS